VWFDIFGWNLDNDEEREWWEKEEGCHDGEEDWVRK